MPKTFTDDVAAALPSALDGPFQVVDPDDCDSYLKIDPEAARIEAAGDARPVRHYHAELSRTAGFAAAADLGTAIEVRSIAASADAGFYAAPFHAPLDMDVTEPISVKVLTAPQSDGGGGTIVRLELVASFGKDGDTSVTNLTTIYDWTTPSGWTTEDLKLVTIDNGNGYTFAGDVFESSDMIGLRIRRLGSAAEDTFPKTLHIAVSMVFEYTAKQL